MDRSPCNRRLGDSSQEGAGRAVGQEDGHRFVVGLAEEFAWWQSLMSTETRWGKARHDHPRV